jgi:hypothetical protein
MSITINHSQSPARQAAVVLGGHRVVAHFSACMAPKADRAAANTKASKPTSSAHRADGVDAMA